MSLLPCSPWKTPARARCHTADRRGQPRSAGWVALPGVCRTTAVLLLLGGQAGCTSVLTTASLRDLVWKGPEHAAEAEPAEAARAGTAAPEAASAPDNPKASAAEGDGGRRTAAIEEAINRLARLGRLDAATEATLVETLQRTQPEDWPVVVDAFAAALPPPEPALPAADPSAAAAPEAGSADDQNPPGRPTPHSAARPVPLPVSAAPAAPEPPTTPAGEAPAADPVSFSPPSPDGGRTPVVPPLAIQNACFASRVRGWGDVDRFADARFEAGQQVIVYFELDGLVAAETAGGCTTRIDTLLTLLGPDGSRLHAWRFEPLEETCRKPRRDYFARYLVRLPDDAAGPCRLEVGVNDLMASQSTGATLPLEIGAAGGRR